MIFKKFVESIFIGKTYWRMTPFAELAQVYLSRFLRTLSQSMVSVFVAVFLYQRGDSLVNIMLYVGGYYVLRILASFVSAYFVAWTGPKRAILTSNILAIPALVSLATLAQHTTASTIGYFVFAGLSLSLFTIAADTQFSSIKRNRFVGHELSWLHIVEKIAAGTAPLIGGLAAFWLGPESIMWAAAGLMLLSAFPLFMTPERTRRQKIIFRGLPKSQIKGQIFSYGVSGSNQTMTETIWPLFVAVVIFGTATDAVYAQLGAVLSLALFVSIGVSHIYGMLIDNRRGRELYLTGAGVNVVVHALRPLVATPLSVVLVNAFNEAGASAYQMSYIRSLYDMADNLPGYRTAYIATMMMGFCAGAALLAFLAAGLLWLFGTTAGFSYSFIAVAVLSLGLFAPGFKSLRRRR